LVHLPTARSAGTPQSPFCVSPPAFVTKTQRVYVRSPKAQWPQVLEFVVPVHQLFLLLVGTLPVWTDTTKTQPRTRSTLNPEDEGSTTVAAQPATQHHITEDLSLNFILDQQHSKRGFQFCYSLLEATRRSSLQDCSLVGHVHS
jgi:hypothetical protein